MRRLCPSSAPVAIPHDKTLPMFGTTPHLRNSSFPLQPRHCFDSCAMAEGHKENCRALYTCIENFNQHFCFSLFFSLALSLSVFSFFFFFFSCCFFFFVLPLFFRFFLVCFLFFLFFCNETQTADQTSTDEGSRSRIENGVG